MVCIPNSLCFLKTEWKSEESSLDLVVLKISASGKSFQTFRSGNWSLRHVCDSEERPQALGVALTCHSELCGSQTTRYHVSAQRI